MSRAVSVLVLLVFPLCGCGPSASTPGAPTLASATSTRSASASETTTPHAEPSAAHALPAHYPGSFVAAVEQLPATFAPLLQDTAPAPDVLQRLRDITRWLPTLAAETDLRRAQWEQAQQAALGLEQLIETHPRVPLAERQARFEQLAADLRALTLAAVPPPHAR